MMKSIRGTYENGSIKLLDPVNLENETNIVITFLDDDFPFSSAPASPQDFAGKADFQSDVGQDDKPVEYYEKLRKHKRYKARGSITIVFKEEELIFPLNDYSAGGLSFHADRMFEVGKDINAALKYNASGEVLIMDFEIIVRGVFEEEAGHYKIGCQFNDNVDEELWHTIMGQ